MSAMNQESVRDDETAADRHMKFYRGPYAEQPVGLAGEENSLGYRRPSPTAVEFREAELGPDFKSVPGIPGKTFVVALSAIQAVRSDGSMFFSDGGTVCCAEDLPGYSPRSAGSTGWRRIRSHRAASSGVQGANSS
jgi:hypothetical protein